MSKQKRPEPQQDAKPVASDAMAEAELRDVAAQLMKQLLGYSPSRQNAPLAVLHFNVQATPRAVRLLNELVSGS